MSALKEEKHSSETSGRRCELINSTKTISRGKENLDKTTKASWKKFKDDHDNNNNNNNNEEFQCYECKQSLASSPELINIAGQPCRRWHPACFKCIICREPMDKRLTCHLYDDQIVCRADYMRLRRQNNTTNLVECARCRWPIGASDWVRKAGQHIYHLACFNCDICSRQLNTGEQFIIGRGESNSTSDVEQAAEPVRLLCRLHFTIDHEKAPRRQSSRDIRGHPSDCGEPATRDQQHLDGTREGGEGEDLAVKSRRQNKSNFSGSHPLGTSADDCSSPLIILTRDKVDKEEANYQLEPTSRGKNLSIVTMHTNQSQQHQHQDPSSASSRSTSRSNASPSTSTSSPSTASNNTTLFACSSGGELGGPATPTGSQSGRGGGTPTSKSKRVRTTFTEDQLSILQTHFQIDSNPDGQDLERIATITGLSKRVTQVWFQNSRARQKKYMIKRKPILVGMAPSMAPGGHSHHLTLNMREGGVDDDDDDDNEDENELESTRAHPNNHNHHHLNHHVRTFDELSAQFHCRSDLFAGVARLESQSERTHETFERSPTRAPIGPSSSCWHQDEIAAATTTAAYAANTSTSNGSSSSSSSSTSGHQHDGSARRIDDEEDRLSGISSELSQGEPDVTPARSE